MIESSLIAGMQSKVNENPMQTAGATSGVGSAGGSSVLPGQDGFWQRFEDSAAALGVKPLVTGKLGDSAGQGSGKAVGVSREFTSGGSALLGGGTSSKVVTSASTEESVSKSRIATDDQKATNLLLVSGSPQLADSLQKGDAGVLGANGDTSLVAGADAAGDGTRLEVNPGAEPSSNASHATEVTSALRHRVQSANSFGKARMAESGVKKSAANETSDEAAEAAISKLNSTQGPGNKPSGISGSEGMTQDQTIAATGQSLRDASSVAAGAANDAGSIKTDTVTNAKASGLAILAPTGKNGSASVDQAKAKPSAIHAAATTLQVASSQDPTGHGQRLSATVPSTALPPVSELNLVKGFSVSDKGVEPPSPVITSGVFAQNQTSDLMGSGQTPLAANGDAISSDKGMGVAVMTRKSGQTTATSENLSASLSPEGEAREPFSKTMSELGLLEAAYRTGNPLKDSHVATLQETRGVAADQSPKTMLPGERKGAVSSDAATASAAFDAPFKGGGVTNEGTSQPVVPAVSSSASPIDLSARQPTNPADVNVAVTASASSVAAMKAAPLEGGRPDEFSTPGVRTIGAGKDRAVETSDKAASDGAAVVQPTWVRFSPEVPAASGALPLSMVHAPSSDSRPSASFAGEQGGRSLPQEIGARMEPGGLEHTTLVATPSVLEVGVASGTNGWLKVRAEMDGTGGVAASVVATTASAVEALHKELPALSAYLRDQEVGVSSLVVNRSDAGAMAQNATAGSGQTGFGAGSFGAGSDSSGRQGETRSQGVDSFVPESGEGLLRGMQTEANGAVLSTAGYGSGSGGSLNVVV